jgi:putative membrane protein
MHMFNDGGYVMGGMHCFWWIFWILLIGVLVFYRWGRPDQQRPSSQEKPHAVLQRRLAEGQLTADEYEKRKALLDRDGTKD